MTDHKHYPSDIAGFDDSQARWAARTTTPDWPDSFWRPPGVEREIQRFMSDYGLDRCNRSEHFGLGKEGSLEAWTVIRDNDSGEVLAAFDYVHTCPPDCE